MSQAKTPKIGESQEHFEDPPTSPCAQKTRTRRPSHEQRARSAPTPNATWRPQLQPDYPANTPGAFAPVVAEVPLVVQVRLAPQFAPQFSPYLQLAPTLTPTPAPRAFSRPDADAYCFACDMNGHPAPSGPFGSQLLWMDPTYPPIPPIPPTSPASPFCGHPGAPAYCFGVCPVSSTRTSLGHGRQLAGVWPVGPHIGPRLADHRHRQDPGSCDSTAHPDARWPRGVPTRSPNRRVPWYEQPAAHRPQPAPQPTAQPTAEPPPRCKTAEPTARPKWGDIRGRNSPDLKGGTGLAAAGTGDGLAGVRAGGEYRVQGGHRRRCRSAAAELDGERGLSSENEITAATTEQTGLSSRCGV